MNYNKAWEQLSDDIARLLGYAKVMGRVEVVLRCESNHDTHALRDYYKRVWYGINNFVDNGDPRNTFDQLSINGITLRIEGPNGD